MPTEPPTPGLPRRRAGGALVPLQSLYGDDSSAVVDFIHIERLRDRSELFDWYIDAHTHAGLHQVVLLFDGGVVVSLDEATHDVPAPAVISIPASVVHSFAYQPSSSGYMLTIADGQVGGSPIDAWLRTRLFDTATTLPLSDDPDMVDRLRSLSSEIANEQRTVDWARTATIDWLTRTVLVLIARRAERADRSHDGAPASDVFRAFRDLVEDHYAAHWTIRRYAEQLHMSESSLNRLCRTVTGATAFEIVQDRIEIEARRRLMYTTVPVHRLAGDLGYPDASYFARFFRKRTGQSPREFRVRHQPDHESGVTTPEGAPG